MFASGTFPAILAAETRAEVRKALRMPAYLIPTLVFPAIIYAVFGLLISKGSIGGLAAASYTLASYGTLGVVGASLFGMGVGVAVERGQGWLMLKSATPMPPLAYFCGKILMCVVIGLLTTSLLSLMAFFGGGVRLEPLQWIQFFAALALGSIPFCALGLALGFVAGPNSAAGIANLIYLPLCLCSGLWMPIEILPKVMQQIAHWLPPYHLARLTMHTVGMAKEPAWPHIAALLAFTGGFLALARLAYRRARGSAWG